MPEYKPSTAHGKDYNDMSIVLIPSGKTKKPDSRLARNQAIFVLDA